MEGNALPTLIFMLRSEDVGIHYEAVCMESAGTWFETMLEGRFVN